MQDMHVSLEGLDLNLLRVLDAVAQHGHVTRAANALGLSQPATSHALARLRAALGDPLFVRGQDGVVLTPRAEALARATRGALVGIEHALREGAAFVPERSTRAFRVAATDGFDIVVLPALLRRLRKLAPSIDLAVVRPHATEVAAMLVSGDADLYYGVLPDNAVFSGLIPDPGARAMQTAKVYDEDWICVARSGHRRLRRAPTLAQYVREEHVLYSPTGSGPGIVDRLLEARGLVRRVALRVSSFHAAVDAVRESDFVWTGPKRIAQVLDPARELRHFSVPLELPRYPARIVWHERYASDPGHRWFRALITASCSASRARR